MNLKKKLFTWHVYAFFLVFYHTYATQNEPTERLNIAQQFKEIETGSKRYLNYKLVDLNTFQKLNKIVLDSLKNNVLEIKALKDKNAELLDKIVRFERSQMAAKQKINKGTVPFFGTKLNVKSYKLIFTLSFITFVIVSTTLFFKFHRANVITNKTQEMLEQTQIDFETFQHNSLERQQELNRKLQDELNKKWKKEERI